MAPLFSIVYAHRNRDAERIKNSFESLRKQRLQNFEVILIDYGSEDGLVHQLEEIAEEFPFVSFYHLPVPQLLWNKSKALNYGIAKANGAYIFIADIDLIFHPETTALWHNLQAPEKFYLFRLGYLDKQESEKKSHDYEFEKLRPRRFGDINGMILSSRKNLLKVNGLDEFFHFYGAEDEDLFGRLENAGYEREQREEKHFYHQWHKSFTGSKDRLVTGNPRVKNIMRINQRHLQSNLKRGIIEPLRQEKIGSFISPERARALKNPDLQFKIPNLLSHVEHFLREELPTRKGEIVRVKFYEDNYYKSIKYRLKKIMGNQTLPYVSIKEVNDMVLKEILYNYRDHNYSFEIGTDLATIVFCVEL